MSVLDFLISPAEACSRIGPHDKIVLSSRVRLARNLRHVPFPTHAKKADRVKAYELLVPAVRGLSQMRSDAFAESMEKLTQLEKQVLVERHLISRELSGAQADAGVVYITEPGPILVVFPSQKISPSPDSMIMTSSEPG